MNVLPQLLNQLSALADGRNDATKLARVQPRSGANPGYDVKGAVPAYFGAAGGAVGVVGAGIVVPGPVAGARPPSGAIPGAVAAGGLGVLEGAPAGAAAGAVVPPDFLKFSFTRTRTSFVISLPALAQTTFESSARSTTSV